MKEYIKEILENNQLSNAQKEYIINCDSLENIEDYLDGIEEYNNNLLD